MVDCRLFLIFLTVILFISTLHAERARNDNLQDNEDFLYENNNENNDDVIEALKRMLFQKKTTTTTVKPTYSVIGALVTTSPRSKITTSTSSIFGDAFGKKTSSTSRYGTSSRSRLSSTRYTTSPKKDACGISNPCKNGGTCRTLSSGRYYCFCSQDYYGKHCETKFMSASGSSGSGSSSSIGSKKDHCSSSPCRNSGECVPLRTTFYCRCKTPYYGISCDKRLAKREEIVEESNSAEQALYAYERDLEEDKEDLRRAIAAEDMLENIE